MRAGALYLTSEDKFDSEEKMHASAQEAVPSRCDKDPMPGQLRHGLLYIGLLPEQQRLVVTGFLATQTIAT